MSRRLAADPAAGRHCIGRRPGVCLLNESWVRSPAAVWKQGEALGQPSIVVTFQPTEISRYGGLEISHPSWSIAGTAENRAMPGHYCFRFHDDRGLGPAKPQRVECDPEQSIDAAQFGTALLPVEHSKLLSKYDRVQREFMPEPR
jgi:hypothetical protein